MLKMLPILLILTLFISCGPVTDELTSEELSKEKEAVVSVIREYNNAVQQQNFAKIVPTLSEDVIFFGSDSAEVIKSLMEFRKKIEEQWKRMDVKYGEMYDISIHMDKRGSLASVIYGTPAVINNKDASTENVFLRVARTLKKEGGNWHIISGIVSIAGTKKVTQATEPAHQ